MRTTQACAFLTFILFILSLNAKNECSCSSKAKSCANNFCGKNQTKCPPKQLISKENNSKIIASIGNEVVTEKDVNERLAVVLMFSNVKLDRASETMLKKYIIESLIDEKTKIQYAKKFVPFGKKEWLSNIDVLREIAYIAESSGLTSKQFLEIFKNNGVDISTFHEQIYARLTWNAFVYAKYNELISCSFSDLRFRKMLINEGLKRVALKVERFHIPFYGQDQKVESKQLADAMVKLIEAGIDFQSLVRQFSNGSNAAHGGSLGFITLGQLPLAEENFTLSAMSIGDIRIVESRYGFSILRLLARRESAETPQKIVKIRYATIPLPKGELTTELVNPIISKMEHIIKNSKNIDDFINASKTSGVNITSEIEIPENELDFQLKSIIKDVKVGDISKPFYTASEVISVCVLNRSEFMLPLPTDEEMTESIIEEKFNTMGEQELRTARGCIHVDKRI